MTLAPERACRELGGIGTQRSSHTSMPITAPLVSSWISSLEVNGIVFPFSSIVSSLSSKLSENQRFS